MKRTGIILATVVLLGSLTACGSTTAEHAPKPSPTPSASESYGDCVARFTMDPSEPQKYIDEVTAACGEAPGQ